MKGEHIMKVVFDAGHGIDTYPPSKGVPEMAEFEFNSAVVGYAKSIAEHNGFDVVLTQPLNGKDVPLRQRTNKANAAGVDVFVSFHANAGPSSARGFEVYHWKTSKNGKKLAELWLKHAKQLYTHRSRGVKTANFHVLRETNMPAILIEHAFMTNKDDLKLLLSENFRKLSAVIAVKALCDYVGREFKPFEEDIVKPVVPAKPSKPKTIKPAETSKTTRKYLAKGDKGAEVKRLQQRLIQAGYGHIMSPYGADGSFGPATDRAVRAFQRDAGIAVDGKVGPQTEKALDKALKSGKGSNDLAKPVLRRGDKGSEVRKLQRQLTNHRPKFDPKGIDGSYGPNTEDAVLRYQKYYGVKPYDGIYGPKTAAHFKKTYK